MKYSITENVQDHEGYKGQLLTKIKELYEDYFIMEDSEGNIWFCGEEELTLIN